MSWVLARRLQGCAWFHLLLPGAVVSLVYGPSVWRAMNSFAEAPFMVIGIYMPLLTAWPGCLWLRHKAKARMKSVPVEPRLAHQQAPPSTRLSRSRWLHCAGAALNVLGVLAGFHRLEYLRAAQFPPFLEGLTGDVLSVCFFPPTWLVRFWDSLTGLAVVWSLTILLAILVALPWRYPKRWTTLHLIRTVPSKPSRCTKLRILRRNSSSDSWHRFHHRTSGVDGQEAPPHWSHGLFRTNDPAFYFVEPFARKPLQSGRIAVRTEVRSSRSRRASRIFRLWLCTLLCATPAAFARINVVTRAGRP